MRKQVDSARGRAADLILNYSPEKLCGGDWLMSLDAALIVGARLNPENAELRRIAGKVLVKYIEDSDKMARLMNVADRELDVDSWRRVITAYVCATDPRLQRFPSLEAIKQSIKSRYGSRPPPDSSIRFILRASSLPLNPRGRPKKNRK